LLLLLLIVDVGFCAIKHGCLNHFVTDAIK